MKAIHIQSFIKTLDDLIIQDIPPPQPKENEVLVQVIAAGVNFVDLLYARGKHQNNTSLVHPPFTLGLEFSGTIILAPKSSSFTPGDLVFASGIGSYAEQITVPETSIRRVPTGWNAVQAAGLAGTAPVSYGALARGKLKVGETVLIHGAAGGLGLAAIQIAKAWGARVIATASTSHKLSIAKNFGADEVVNYSSNSEWHKEVLKVTGGKGVDLVFDSVGLVDKSLKCLAPKGRVLIVGFAGTEGKMEKIGMNRVLLRQAEIIGYRAGMSERMAPGETKEIWKDVEDLVQKGLLRPTVFEMEYRGLKDVVRAMKDLEGRKVWGKAVVQMTVDEGTQRSKL